MPNHFHFLIYIPSFQELSDGIESSDSCSKNISGAIAIILRSYTQAINKKYDRTGSLFQQKTKAKDCEVGGMNYPFICFHYIHQNPVKSKLVNDLGGWKYSSYLDYSGKRNGTLINKKLTSELLGIPLNFSEFVEQSKSVSAIDFKL